MIPFIGKLSKSVSESSPFSLTIFKASADILALGSIPIPPPAILSNISISMDHVIKDPAMFPVEGFSK